MLALAAAVLIAAPQPDQQTAPQPDQQQVEQQPPAPTELIAVTETGEALTLSVTPAGEVAITVPAAPIAWPEGHDRHVISNVHESGHALVAYDHRAATFMLMSRDGTTAYAPYTVDVDATVERRGMCVLPSGAVLVLHAIGPTLRVLPEDWWRDGSCTPTDLVRLKGVGVLEALASAPDGTIYALGNDPDADVIASRALYTVCLNTGETSKIADLPVRDLDALVFASDGMLYATDANGRDAHLFRIDPADGATADLGAVGVVGITALARLVPELFRGCG